MYCAVQVCDNHRTMCVILTVGYRCIVQLTCAIITERINEGTSGVRQTDTPSRSLAGTRPPDSAIVHCFVSLCTCPCTHAVINKPRTAIDHTRKTGRCTCSSANGMYSGTGPRSAVVSASDCGSEGLGFESHQSHVGFFSPGRLLPSGKAGTTQPSFIHFTDASLRVLL